MTLVQAGAFFQDATGEEETIVLQTVQAVASDGTDEASAQIASANYGTDAAGNPLPVAVNPDGRSLKLKTLLGLNTLTVNAISASGADATVQLVQNGTTLSETIISGHTGSTALMIEGT